MSEQLGFQIVAFVMGFIVGHSVCELTHAIRALKESTKELKKVKGESND